MLLALPPNQNGYETCFGRTGVFLCLLAVGEVADTVCSKAAGAAVDSGMVTTDMLPSNVSDAVLAGCFVLGTWDFAGDSAGIFPWNPM